MTLDVHKKEIDLLKEENSNLRSNITDRDTQIRTLKSKINNLKTDLIDV